jgi:hypothetical protein
MQAVTEIKRFKLNEIDDTSLRILIEEIEGGFQIDEDTIKSIVKHEKVRHDELESSRIDEEIRKFIDENPEVLKRYAKNKKLADYVAGEIIKRYKSKPKEVLKRTIEILNSMINQN